MKIAHISDLHMRHHLPGTSASPRRLSRQMPDLLVEAVERIERSDPDLVAVTGDLVDHPFVGYGDPDRLARGERDLGLIKEILSGFSCPVAVVYGNHDHPDLFARVFGMPAGIEVAGHRVLSFYDREVSNHVPQRMGAERERFLAVLRDGDPRPQIHLQHYLIAPERNQGYPHTYLEGESIRQGLVEDGRVRLALSGHYHRGEDLFRDGPVHFGIAPAFAEPPHPYRIYHLNEEGVAQEEGALRPEGERGEPRPAVFLDRDGTINPQPSYRTGPEDFRLMEGVGEALARLEEREFALVIVSNQTAVGLGYVTADTVSAVNDRMSELLEPFGVAFDGVYCCYASRQAVIPHFRAAEPETKPNPAMLLRAAKTLNLDLSRSYMVGDSRSDLQAGRNARCRGTVLVETGNGARSLVEMADGEADHVAGDLSGAVDWILTR